MVIVPLPRISYWISNFAFSHISHVFQPMKFVLIWVLFEYIVDRFAVAIFKVRKRPKPYSIKSSK